MIACRDLKRGENAAKEIREEAAKIFALGRISVVQMDLSSFASIRKAVQEILNVVSRIDILVNNAGVMWCPYKKTEDGFEMHFGVNHLGHFQFTCLLLPKIIQSAPSRIITVSSMVYVQGNIDFDDLNWEKTPYSAMRAYARSKLANILFTKELAERLKGTNVSAYCLHPGVISTELQRHMNETYFSGAEILFRSLITITIAKTPEQGAQTTIYCAVDEKIAEESGFYYSDCKKKEVSSKAKDPVTARRLWEKSFEMVQLGNFDPFSGINNSKN